METDKTLPCDIKIIILFFILLFGENVTTLSQSSSRITHRWGEHATATFRNVTQDATLIDIYNEGNEYIGIRSDQDKHTLIYFDVSAIHNSTVVYKAKLRIFFEVAYGTVDQNKSGYMMNIYRVTDPNSYGMWIEDQVTRNQRKDGVSWTTSGDLFTSISTAPIDSAFSHPFAYGMGADNFLVEWDVTTTVQGWISGSFPNQGFFLDGRTTLNQDAIAHSSEHPDSLTRPYLEITYAGTGAYPPQVSNVQAQYKDGQTFITWKEISSDSSETRYRIYRHTSPITSDNLATAEFIDEVPQASATFHRLAENGGRLSTPFSIGLLANDVGLYVYTVEKSGGYYYAVTSVFQGNENRSIYSNNTAGPVNENVTDVSPVLQYRDFQDSTASGNRFVYIVWLGKFDPTGRYSDYGFNNRRSVPYIFRITAPETWNPTDTYPLLVVFHFFSDSYFGGGHSVPEPDRFVFAADDHDPIMKANDYGHTVWYGYNSNYGTRRAPTAGIVVNYTERRLDWMFDWLLNRNTFFKIDKNRIYMKGGSMGGVAQWAYGIRHPQIFAAGENAVPGVNLNFDPDQRHFVLWGYESSIKNNENIPVKDRIDAGWYAMTHPEIDFPIMQMFVRKDDEHILWGQMPSFFKAMDSSRHIGGVLQWLQGDHIIGDFPWGVFSEWSSEEEYQDWIYQFKLNQSYPAFSRFSLNGNAGNGDPKDGDLRGGINRFLRWDIATIIDTTNRWEISLQLHNAAPVATATADVTPRRLQSLIHTSGASYKWMNRQQPSNSMIQSGTVAADANGLLTIPQVQITKSGNRIVIADIFDDVNERDEPVRRGEFVLYQNYPNPFTQSTVIGYQFAVGELAVSHVKLEVFDILGRKITTIAQREFDEGVHTIIFDQINLSPGIYFYQLSAEKFYQRKTMVVIK